MTEIKTLLVMPEAEQKVFAKLLVPRGVAIFCAAGCARARELLLRHCDIHVIVTALSLPDGNWWSLHRALMELDHDAQIIVFLPDASHCASKILAHGAFAVVTPPFTARELLPLIATAAATQLDAKQQQPNCAGRVIG
jgi:DNA-binding NtrC family response regulator